MLILAFITHYSDYLAVAINLKKKKSLKGPRNYKGEMIADGHRLPMVINAASLIFIQECPLVDNHQIKNSGNLKANVFAWDFFPLSILYSLFFFYIEL